jgi:hypothetical protein
MLTLQEFIDEINSQIPENAKKMSQYHLENTFFDYCVMFRNEFNEVPNFDIDDYGRIILLRPEMMG